MKQAALRSKSPQIPILAKEKSAYGGSLLKTRKGRSRGRPLSTKETMHLVLRSTKAKGDWSFKRPRNEARINRIVDKFAVTYGVRVISMANVGNHLHLHIKLSSRFGYRPFICAITSAIAMAITGRNRWTAASTATRERFWDYRPFTRFVESFKAYLNLKDYVRINQLEGDGHKRDDARFMLGIERGFAAEPDWFAS